MEAYPLVLPTRLAKRLRAAVDREGKVVRALDALGPIAGCDVRMAGGTHAPIADQLAAAGARIRPITTAELQAKDARSSPDPADVLVSWGALGPPTGDSLAALQRHVRPGGRLLLIHDYGRDDVSRLFGPRPEYGEWSHRDGPFLANGFKVRVVHAWWTFDSLDEARSFLAAAFGDAGDRLGAELTRPRLSYNVAIYHRSVDAS